MQNSSISPYQGFLFQGHILDEKGNKMSKRLGNIVEGYKTLNENSVDLLRFYLMRKADPAKSLNFSFEEMNARPYQVISTLFNLHKYLKQNGDYDNFDKEKHTLDWAINQKLLSSPDYWILSKLQNLVCNITDMFIDSNFDVVTKLIDDFTIESFSQIYLPMVRNEIWNDDESQLNRRLSIYSIISHILHIIDILLHPISNPLKSVYAEEFIPKVATEHRTFSLEIEVDSPELTIFNFYGCYVEFYKRDLTGF